MCVRKIVVKRTPTSLSGDTDSDRLKVIPEPDPPAESSSLRIKELTMTNANDTSPMFLMRAGQVLRDVESHYATARLLSSRLFVIFFVDLRYAVKRIAT